MMASTMTLPNLAFSLILKSLQQAPTSVRPVSNDQGNRSALASSQPNHHIDIKA